MGLGPSEEPGTMYMTFVESVGCKASRGDMHLIRSPIRENHPVVIIKDTRGWKMGVLHYDKCSTKNEASLPKSDLVKPTIGKGDETCAHKTFSG